MYSIDDARKFNKHQNMAPTRGRTEMNNIPIIWHPNLTKEDK